MPGNGALVALIGLGAVAYIITKECHGSRLIDFEKYVSDFMNIEYNFINHEIYRSP